MKKTYCKQHSRFDDCDSKVAKRKDDGIHHLLGTSRSARSPETRAGDVQGLETGKRQLDGTPMTGIDEECGDIKESDKHGKATRSKRVGQSRIREQVAKSDPFGAFAEVSKLSAFGTHGDKRNTKYALAGYGGANLGSLAGGAIGARVGGSSYPKVMRQNVEGANRLATKYFNGRRPDEPRGMREGLKLSRDISDELEYSVKGLKEAKRGAKIGAAVGLAVGTAAYAKHRANKGLGRSDRTPGQVAKRDFSTAERSKLASKGDALPGGKLPIRSRHDLANAEKLKGHVKGESSAEVNAYIERKKKELGVSKSYELCGHDAFAEIEKADLGGIGELGRGIKGATKSFGEMGSAKLTGAGVLKPAEAGKGLGRISTAGRVGLATAGVAGGGGYLAGRRNRV